jgi:hypothetical protein
LPLLATVWATVADNTSSIQSIAAREKGLDFGLPVMTKVLMIYAPSNFNVYLRPTLYYGIREEIEDAI